MPDVTIAIASCGRGTLARTLASLDALEVPQSLSVNVLIADDDPGGAAAKLAASCSPLRFPLKVIAVGARNISHARNACLDAARGSMLAFIDDDEWVAPDWLARMLACKREFGARAVFGPVYPQYPEDTPGWLVRANPLHVDWGRRGRHVETGRSGNTLLDLDFVREKGLRFDAALGLTGGEDTAFFAAFHRAGGRMVVTDDATVYEHVPPHRLELDYIRARALRSGRSWAGIRLDAGASAAARAVFALDAAAKMAVAFALAAFLRPFDPARSLRFSIKAWMNRGKLHACADGLAAAGQGGEVTSRNA